LLRLSRADRLACATADGSVSENETNWAGPQQTLDAALQRFTRRTAEAAQGTGEAKDALAQMGIALRDQDGHLRRSEDLLADVADAFARIEDPAERVRLAFKLFDSEGVALVNLLSDGSGARSAGGHVLHRQSIQCQLQQLAQGQASRQASPDHERQPRRRLRDVAV
jgi:hypothetical protein